MGCEELVEYVRCICVWLGAGRRGWHTVATGINQPIPHTRTIAVALALAMSNVFDTVNIHTLIDKFTHPNIPWMSVVRGM